MSTIVLLASRRPPRPPGEKPLLVPAPANDDVLAAVGVLRGPEIALTVSFVGLTEAEQRKALASFPGARRCVLAVA